MAHKRQAAWVAAAYAALTVAFTWPLVRGITHDLVGDYGDPLLNVWILAWDATHMLARGNGWWNANIFYPHPLTLGYSEHLAAQAIQILPIHWLTGNAILCYNLVFLSTFVLSGLGTFLLVRELTGSARGAFVAGLAFAFAPYRTASVPHIQVLSSAWMPFVLYGFRRYFTTRHLLPLGGAALAWLLQNLSCGYYLLFFSPIVVLYLVWELSARRLWRDAATVGALAAACALVGAATLPFLLPYRELRWLGFNPRSLSETQRFSADVYGYLTADPNMAVWGRAVRAWPKAEGALFPGFTILALALAGAARPLIAPARRDRRLLAGLGIVAAVAITIVYLLLGGSIRLPGIRIASLGRVLTLAAIAAVAALAVSRTVRSDAATWLRDPTAWFVLMTLFAVAMSFGPRIEAQGRVVLNTNVYAFFYQYVPGFDGLRVPARFAMIAALGLSVLAGFGVARLRAPNIATIIVTGLICAESFAGPVPINQHPADYARPGLAALPDLQRDPPPVYRRVRTLPDGVPIVELPLGEPAFDVRYMYYSTFHWRPLVNGYSGGLPADYDLLDRMLQDVFTQPERAWRALRGARYVIVHEAFYQDDRGPRVSAWLRQHHAAEIGTFGSDHLFQLR